METDKAPRPRMCHDVTHLHNPTARGPQQFCLLWQDLGLRMTCNRTESGFLRVGRWVPGPEHGNEQNCFVLTVSSGWGSRDCLLCALVAFEASESERSS